MDLSFIIMQPNMSKNKTKGSGFHTEFGPGRPSLKVAARANRDVLVRPRRISLYSPDGLTEWKDGS